MLVATWRGDPHKDHVTTAGVARRVARFEAGPHQAAEAAAIACHRSQMTGLVDDDPQDFMMSASLQAHVIDHPEANLPE